MSSVIFYSESNIGVISLDEGNSGNRLDPVRLEKIINALDELANNDSCRVIFIRARGENFCLGMDLEKAASAGDPVQIGKAVRLYSELLDKLHNSDAVTIAIVNGPVKAGGVGLVAACDIVIASEKSDFELSEAIFGIIPANVLPYLYMLRLSPQKSKYLILTASKINALEACRIGLADEVCTVSGMEKRARSIARQLLRISPQAVREYKKFSGNFAEFSMEERKSAAVKKIGELLNRKETIDAIKGFNEGLTPEWFSRFKSDKSITEITGE